MRKNLLFGIAAVSLALAGGMTGQAQPYSNAVMALNPAAYWPLNETAQPPSGAYIATNRGTAGAFANGFYETWYQPLGTAFYQTNNIIHPAGATGDGDTAMQCVHAAGGIGQYVVFPRFTNGVANPAVTLTAPFAIEFWAYPTTTTTTVMPIVNEGRNPVIDASTGYLANNEDGFSVGQYGTIFYFATWNNRGGDSTKQEIDTALTANQWQHMVINFDGTNQTWFKNGVQVGTRAIAASATNSAGQRYTVDLTSPLLIGTGSIIAAGNGASEWGGNIDEVAIYTNVLASADIQAHYTAAPAADSSYVNAVLANNPLIYLRLDEPAMPASSYPSASSYPVANNYGSLGAAANAVYQPGATPGVAGPSSAGFGAGSEAVAFNGFSGGVGVGQGSLPAALNPTNNQPVTVAAWFQGDPADAAARFQEIVGHGNNSWRIALDNNGGLRFNPGNGPELQFASITEASSWVVNDGLWHFVAGVSDGTNDWLYVDGALAKTGASVGVVAGSTSDVVIGGDPQFTVPAYNGSAPRYFEGQIAHVAVFTNALAAAQIQQLYSTAGNFPPKLHTQPVSQTINQGTNLTLTALASGSSTLTYLWYKNGSPVPGATTSSLVYNPANPTHSGNYYVVATNPYGNATSVVAQITVYGPPVVAQQSLTSMRVFAGAYPTLHVTAVGPTPTYLWTLNGTAIGSATSSSYTVPNIQTSGSYGCMLTNIYGTNFITPISITVLALPSAPLPRAVIADRAAAYFRLDEGPDNGAGNNGTIGYDFASGNNGSYSNVTLALPGYSPNLDPSETATYFGASGINSYLGKVPNYLSFGTSNGTSGAFSVEAWVNASSMQGTDAGIVTLGYGNGGEQFDLDTGGTAARNFRWIVRDAGGGAHVINGTVAPSDGNWHHVVGVCDQPSGKVYFYVDGRLNGSGTITAGSGILSSTNSVSIGSRQSALGAQFDSQFVGEIDDVAIYGYALSSNQVVAHYVDIGIAPFIVQDVPVSITTNEGATVSIPLQAAGTAPLSYYWYDPFSNLVPGATSNTLVLKNVSPAQNGAYSCVVSNVFGEGFSSGCTLTVVSGPPQILADIQPQFATNREGVLVTYTVEVGGTAPFTYAWYSNNVPIVGATNATYTLETPPGTNVYHLLVTNTHGSTPSGDAVLVGLPVPHLNPGDYTYKMQVKFTGYNKGETLVNFPALVNIGTNLPGFAYSQLASPTGGDLRFTDASGIRQLPHEIDEWNVGGVSPVWVQVPALSSTNDYVWAYWGNPAVTTPLAWSTNGTVWSNQFLVVYHLKDTNDSTLQHTAVGGAPAPLTPGIIGQGGLFGGGDWLDAGVVDLGNAFTLSAWVNIPSGTSDIQTLWANQVGGFGSAGCALFVDSYQTADRLIDFATGIGGGTGNESKTTQNVVGSGQFHLLSVAVNRDPAVNGHSEFYVDGTDVASGIAYAGFTNVADLNLGRFIGGAFGFHGVIDEARIASNTNSANWIWADYMTVAQNTALQTYAPIASSAVTLQYQVINGKLVLSWSQGTLQSASLVTGNYNDLTGITSPYTNAPSGTQQYFRVKVR